MLYPCIFSHDSDCRLRQHGVVSSEQQEQEQMQPPESRAVASAVS